MVLSRLVRHKKLEIVIEAFSRMNLPLTVIGDGPDRSKLMMLAAPNVAFLGALSNEAVAERLARARALVHVAEEDFGLVLAEAQAAGCPVIAYRGGAAPEIVVDGSTGVLFSAQTVESLTEAVQRFERAPKSFQPQDAIANACRFSKTRFQAQFAKMVEREWSSFVTERR